MAYAFSFPQNIPAFTSQPTQTRVLSRNVRNFLDSELKLDLQGKHFLLAVSGGVDSLALLCLWIWLRPIYKHSLSVCHIDHMLRGESTLEAKTIAALCKAWDIECFIQQVDVAKCAAEQKKGLEEMARLQRYHYLEQYGKKCHASWICLAHHLGDLQEDILMRLMRGSGWPALGGMAAVDNKRHILRPLLLQDKNSLYNLLQHAGLGFAHDKSNDDDTFLRNRVRNNIMPLIQAENPSFEQKARELWRFANYDAQYWHGMMEQLFLHYNISIVNEAITLPADLLKSSDKATRLRLYMHAIQLLISNSIDIKMGQARAQTLLELDDAFEQGRGNITFELPGKITAYLKKGTVVISIQANSVL